MVFSGCEKDNPNASSDSNSNLENDLLIGNWELSSVVTTYNVSYEGDLLEDLDSTSTVIYPVVNSDYYYDDYYDPYPWETMRRYVSFDVSQLTFLECYFDNKSQTIDCEIGEPDNYFIEGNILYIEGDGVDGGAIIDQLTANNLQIRIENNSIGTTDFVLDTQEFIELEYISNIIQINNFIKIAELPESPDQ